MWQLLPEFSDTLVRFYCISRSRTRRRSGQKTFGLKAQSNAMKERYLVNEENIADNTIENEENLVKRADMTSIPEFSTLKDVPGSEAQP